MATSDAIGPILIIVFIGIVYLFFNKVDSDKNDKDAQVHVKKTMADVELGKLQVQQEELRLKQEILKFKQGENKPRGLEAEYKVLDQIEDKSKKTKEEHL